MSSSRLVVEDIKAMLDAAQSSTSGTCCIYKVPSDIRTLNENAYTPKLVSIGPFHHRHPHSYHQNMEGRKLNYLEAFLHRTRACLNDLVCYVESILSNFKSCYSESLPFSDNELVKLILIDSVFIIELFWRFSQNVFLKPWLDVGTRSDLMLLENQLPFFVIEKIYSLSCSTYASVPNTKFPSFLELTFDYFQNFNISKLSFDNKYSSIRHFTDLIRIFHIQHHQSWLSRPKINIVMDELVLHLPSATELLETGVKFKVNTKSDCLLDLSFSGRVLEIPLFKVDYWTETLLRNMIALEQCHYPHCPYITDYVAVLNFLIKTGADADILVQSKILKNFHGDSDSVAHLYKGLCKNIIAYDIFNFSSEFSNLCKELNTFCRNPLHKLKLKATLMRDYCNTPWQIAASIAGILLLVLTIIQTVCSVLQVVQQPNAS